MGALDGIRVIDFGQYLAGPLAAMLLADQGAEVIHIDPPGGPRWRNPANATLNRAKQHLTLDLKSGEDRAYARRLIDTADVVIENFRPGVMDRLGVGAEASIAANPALVYLSLPGFAHDDPRASLSAWEGVISAATGAFWGRNNDGKPVFTAVPISSSFGALAGAIATVMALIARERDGLGQRIEVPLFDATFLAIGANGLMVNGKPGGGRPDDPWVGVYRAADGEQVRLNLATVRFLRLLADALGKQEWYDRGWIMEERPGNLPSVSPARAEFDREMEALFLTRTSDEWEALARDISVPMTKIRPAAEWIQQAHAREAGLIAELDDPELGPMLQPGPAVRLYGSPAPAVAPRPNHDASRDDLLRRPVPAPRSNAERIGRALEGVRVLDLSQVLAGPTAARTLAEFGAEVIKINNPWEEGAGYRWNAHRYHTDVNRGKETVLVDLKTPDGLDLFWRLAEGSDVVLQNFRRGVAERMGIGYEQVRSRVPGVVFGSISFYGYDGPWERFPGYEPNAQSATGIGYRHKGMMPFPVNDYTTGLLGAFALSLGLFHRRRTGEGQHVTTSLAAAGTYLQTPFMQLYEGKKWDEPSGPEALGWSPLQRLYQASDGWLFLGATPDRTEAMSRLDRLSEIAGLQDEALAAKLADAIAGKTADEWVRLLATVGAGAQRVVPAMPLMTDPWVVAHGLSITRTHAGGDQITTIGPPFRLSRTPVVPGAPASPPGADAPSVLAKAGIPDRLEDYVQRKVMLLE